MHTTMANETIFKDGKTFLKCKQCGQFKEINKDNWYYHKEGYLGVLGRCRECIRAGRKTEHELEMARKRDNKRYKSNPNRRKLVYESSRKRNKRHLEENKKWDTNHTKTQQRIRRGGGYPKKCPICGREGRIVAHHQDINIWNEIVFCCQICHDKIHKGKITKFKVIDVKKYNIGIWL